MFNTISDIPYQRIAFTHDIQLTVKRIDLVHPTISGNKFFKLKYNLIEARQRGLQQLLSFGGAYSNHIYALAHAAHDYGFSSVGIIRGEELQNRPRNHSLQCAEDLGMQLEFISRTEYRQKHSAQFLADLKTRYPDSYIIPEGGSNTFAIKGCEEILSAQDRQDYDAICCAVGTGGTIAGIINASAAHQHIVGFAALKGDFLQNEIQKWTTKTNWSVFSDEHFGGYGKYDAPLLSFIQHIKQQYQIPLEPIYTGKAFYYLLELIQSNYFPASTRILFIHTGGLHAFANLT